jgi:hypothetical protein
VTTVVRSRHTDADVSRRIPGKSGRAEGPSSAETHLSDHGLHLSDDAPCPRRSPYKEAFRPPSANHPVYTASVKA